MTRNTEDHWNPDRQPQPPGQRKVPSYDEYFKPSFLNLSNLPHGGIQGTIVAAGFEVIGKEQEEKPVIRIEDETGDLWAFVVNQSSGATLGAIYGRGFEFWTGKSVCLAQGTANYKGKSVASIVIDAAATRKLKTSSVPVGSGSDIHPGDKDIPF